LLSWIFFAELTNSRSMYRCTRRFYSTACELNYCWSSYWALWFNMTISISRSKSRSKVKGQSWGSYDAKMVLFRQWMHIRLDILWFVSIKSNQSKPFIWLNYKRKQAGHKGWNTTRKNALKIEFNPISVSSELERDSVTLILRQTKELRPQFSLKWSLNTIRHTIFTCAQKLTNSQLHLPHRTNKQKE